MIQQTELQLLREQIDTLDVQLNDVLRQRRACVAEVRAVKMQHGLPVSDRGREQAMLKQMLEAEADEEFALWKTSLFTLLFALSRLDQWRGQDAEAAAQMTEKLRALLAEVDGLAR